MATTRPLILVIDDRQDIFRFCQRSLGDDYSFVHAANGRAAKAILRNRAVAAVLVDRDFSMASPDELLGPREDVRNEGLYLLRWLRSECPELPLIMVTGLRDLPTAVAAADLNAQFLAWEEVVLEPALLADQIEHALDTTEEENDTVEAEFRRLGVVAESPAFIRVLRHLYRALSGNAPILLLGPTGCGKDTLAYAAHELSGDRARPFIAVNVATLSPSLVESELFGHARGAFTGAVASHLGKLRAAHGGTLFLNEIGDLPPDLQTKLLTVLERHEVVPVGDIRSYPAEFRLISATSRDLGGLVAGGRFRRDLLHRIAWHAIELPPLSARPECIPPLAVAFLENTSAKRRGTVQGLSREALEYLPTLPWDGNVRELRAVIEAACAHARRTVTVTDLRDVIRRREAFSKPAFHTIPGDAQPTADGPFAGMDFEQVKRLHGIAGESAMSTATRGPDSQGPESNNDSGTFSGRSHEQLTRAYYFHLKCETGGSLPQMARLAGISRSTIYEWRKRFDGAGDSADAAEA